ncbi:hypothetical protein JTY60_00830 [symbiont of Argiope bruennichi]|uniref:hypothetical protein n=1 Tax=symbiont of Argiope bruennichi TaxID=2810479 RepID=UPI003DA2E212
MFFKNKSKKTNDNFDLGKRKSIYRFEKKEKEIKEFVEDEKFADKKPFLIRTKNYFFGIWKEYVTIKWMKKTELFENFFRVLWFSLFFIAIFITIDVLMNIFRFAHLL